MEATGDGGGLKSQTREADRKPQTEHTHVLVLDHNNRMPRACKVENEIASDEQQTEGEIMTVNNPELAER
jgi:hypothetical protein